MNKTVGVLAIVLAVVGVSGYLYVDQMHTNTTHHDATESVVTADGAQVTLYKDPNCGCCEGYAAVLRQDGFVVTVESTSDMAAIKERYAIPPDGESCHTAVIGDYVIEGHVPLEAVAKLLADKPAIAGIGLARMPAGTPGMPGVQRAPYEIYQIDVTGQVSPYLTI